ncbi:MAG: RDD family protein, partial [bacterium]
MIVCPRCSRSLDGKDINFCPSCGTRVSDGQQMDSPSFSPSPDRGDSHPDTQPASAGFWIRMLAFWLDALVILSIAIIIGSLTYSTFIGKALFPNRDKACLFFTILFIMYHALFLGRFRTTPGKRFFGLAVSPMNPSRWFGYSDAFL